MEAPSLSSEIVEGEFAAVTALASLQTLPGTPVSSHTQLTSFIPASSSSAIDNSAFTALTLPGSSEEDDDDGSSVVPPEEEVGLCLLEV